MDGRGYGYTNGRQDKHNHGQTRGQIPVEEVDTWTRVEESEVVFVEEVVNGSERI